MADTIDSASPTAPPDPTSDIHIFLLAEVRDFTRFSQERGDEEATRLVDRFARIARQVVHAGAGKVIELRGDEALAVFGSARVARCRRVAGALYRGDPPRPIGATACGYWA